MTGDPAIPVEIIIGEQIDIEIRAAQVRLEEIDTRAFDLQDLCAKADEKAELTGKPEDQAEYDHLHRQLTSYINAGISLSQKIQTLRSTSELERRVNEQLANQASLRRLLMSETQTEKPAKVTPADQGIPADYLREDGKSFKIGMDARLKSDLVNSVLGLITEADPGQSLHVFSEKEAVRLLGLRDWMGFLDRKRDIETAKAAKKEAAAAAREVKAREAAEAKATKDAEKKATAEAKKAEAASTATPATGKAAGKSGGTSKADQMRAQREAQAAGKS